MNLATLAIMLFLIMDPIGNIPIYVKELSKFSPARQRLIVLREMGLALGMMLLFSLIGEYIFWAIGVNAIAVGLSSGVILFMIALKMLFPQGERYPEHWSYGDEPFIVPLVVPAIAGPGLLATIMLFSHMEPSVPKMLSAIGLAWLAALSVLIGAPWLKRNFNQNAMTACERLMGMILILLATQRFLEGIRALIQTL